MMGLLNGHYRTAAGSEMWISGEHSGRSRVEFDWLEEGACPDCTPDAYEHDGMLIWHCDQCGGGQAELLSVTPNNKGPGKVYRSRRIARDGKSQEILDGLWGRTCTVSSAER